MKVFMCFAALAFLCVFYGLAVYNTPKTDATVQATDFVAGRIIDDAVFYNANTMTVEEIQAFLDEKLPTCDMWGTGSSAGRVVSETGYVMPAGSTNADYARLRAAAGNTRYHEPPYVCVNKYYENPETHETLYETKGIVKDGMISAAQIIYNEAQRYSINPQVLLVLLKKESYVWGDTWPLKWEYNSAMGYGCPDTAPCDTAYYGFYNQVHMAAYQFDRYKQKNYEYNYHPGMVNNIYYSPTYSCGTKQVYIENMATASLYIYTPYTPNDAALQNYPGTSYCGSYGNRNFFMYFSEWFGSTFIHWEDMITPRYMTVRKGITQYNLSGDAYKETTEDTTLYFRLKTYINGIMYLKAQDGRIYKYEDLVDAVWEWGAMVTPRYLARNDNSKIININTNVVISENNDIKYFDLKTYTPDGDMCLRSQTDPEYYCAIFDTLSEVEWEKKSLLYPRDMSVPAGTKVLDPTTKKNISVTESENKYYFEKQIILPDFGQCLIVEYGKDACILYDDTEEVVSSLDDNRMLEVVKDSYKIRIDDGKEDYSIRLLAGMQRVFVAKTYVRSEYGFTLCLLSQYDVLNSTGNCIRYDNLRETITNISPRTMVLEESTYKKSINDGSVNRNFYVLLGTSRIFVAKSNIRVQNSFDVIPCMLTEYDLEHATKSCIERNLLKEV